MRELAEVLLTGPSSLTSAEREMIATFVSTLNDCHFCQSSHQAPRRTISAELSCCKFRPIRLSERGYQ
jgi:AhpD family alkylhydroperoxidase